MASVHLVYGPLGAGKTTYARTLAEQSQGVRFSIDEWMQRLFSADQPPALSLAWVMPRVRRCEEQIWQTAQQVLASGRDVVLDLGFLKAADRQRFRELAQGAGHPVQGHYLDAERSERRARVLRRNEERGQTFSFEVSGPMFDLMDAQFQAPGPQELGEARHG